MILKWKIYNFIKNIFTHQTTKIRNWHNLTLWGWVGRGEKARCPFQKALKRINTSCSKAFIVMLFILKILVGKHLYKINHISMSTHAFKFIENIYVMKAKLWIIKPLETKQIQYKRANWDITRNCQGDGDMDNIFLFPEYNKILNNDDITFIVWGGEP